MKRCPNCNSRKFKQFDKGKWKCLKCGFEWWNPRYHATISPKEQRWGGVNGNAIALIDYHNIVYKFSILKDNPEVHLPDSKQMRGWNQEWEEVNDVKFQRTPHSIIIFLNKRILREDVGVVELEVLDMVKLHARKFQERYAIKLDIDHPEPVRKEVKLLEGFRSAEQFIGDKVKCVYPDGRIEFIDKNKAVTQTQFFIENLSLESKSADILKAMDGGFNTLAYLMTQQNEINAKLLEIFSNHKPEGLTVKMLKFFGFWLAKVKSKTIPSSKNQGGEKNGEKISD